MRTSKIITLWLIALVLLAGSFSGGLLVGWGMPNHANSDTGLSLPALFQESSSKQASNREELFAPFWQAWDIVHDQYVEQPVNDETMMQGAIEGMLQSLGDPHTSYMNPDQYRQQNMPLQGEYEGIGAWVDITGDYLKIVSPMPGSPAEKAGLKPEDQVIAIDGEDMTGLDGNLVLRQVLGPAGTRITLTIRREGLENPFDVTIERQKIIVPSAGGKMLDGNIAYIQLFTFGEESAKELREKIQELMKNNPTGMILDLRNNGGGYLTTAVKVVSEFIPGNKIAMYEEMGDGKRQSFQTTRGGLATDIPLVVLVNEGTASASEITAGAIQDYQRGQLVGSKTYGKGSVQNWIPLDNEQGAIRVTIARWLTPNERQINKIGLTPDVEVKFTEEDYKAGRDPQLEKALELLQDN
ncbi:MAG: S41 family peptidase [Anaerolineaceae bacterium]|nr:S41 family peptidase [Anaerolineaceae bacterium]